MPVLPKQTIIANINAEILDNSAMLISPYDVRHNLIDIIDSTHLFLANNDLVANNFSTPDTRTTALRGPSAGFTVELPMGSNGTTFGLDYSYRHTDPFQGSHTIGARINL